MLRVRKWTKMECVRLARARTLRGYSIDGLAAAAKVTHQTIVNLEHGRTKRPHPATMKAIADALQVDPLDVDEFRVTLGLPPLPEAE